MNVTTEPAIITADEISFIGYVFDTDSNGTWLDDLNPGNGKYLNTATNYYSYYHPTTVKPSGSTYHFFYDYKARKLDYDYFNTEANINPIIKIRSIVLWAGGDGSREYPYRVKLN